MCIRMVFINLCRDHAGDGLVTPKHVFQNCMISVTKTEVCKRVPLFVSWKVCPSNRIQEPGNETVVGVIGHRPFCCIMSFVVSAGRIKTESVILMIFYKFYFVSRDQMLRSLQHFIWMFKGSHKIVIMLVLCKILFRGSVNLFFVLLVTCFGYKFFSSEYFGLFIIKFFPKFKLEV